MAYSTVSHRLKRDRDGKGNRPGHTVQPIIKQKPEEAFKMLNKVIEKKNSSPKYNLFIEDVDNMRGYNPSKYYYYSIYTCAMFVVADMYEAGVGIKKNKDEAARWRKLAIAELKAEQNAIDEYLSNTNRQTMGLY